MDINSIDPKYQGMIFHMNDMELAPQTIPIHEGDVIFLKYHNYHNSGRLLIADDNITINEKNHGVTFKFKENPHYKGISEKNTAIRGFAYKIKEIKEFDPLFATHFWITKIYGPFCEVHSDEYGDYLIESCRNLNMCHVRLGGIQWGRINHAGTKSDFTVVDTEYPISSKKL